MPPVVRFRGDAIARHPDAVVAQVRVERGIQDAGIGGDAGDDERRDAEVVEQELERRAVEGRVSGLEHRVVGRGGAHVRGDLGRRAALREAGPHHVGKVRAPVAEIVVRVDHRPPRLAAACGERRGIPRGAQRVGRELARVREIERVEHVDQQERLGGPFHRGRRLPTVTCRRQPCCRRRGARSAAGRGEPP